MIRILLRFPHGLGDVVQFSVVLKHLRKHRPEWEVTVRCGRGKHTALLGQCHAVSHDQEDEPRGPFDTEATLGWYENYSCYSDKPNSKITNCLSEVFGLDYDASLGRYQVSISEDARERARRYLDSIGAVPFPQKGKRIIIVHYEGNTSVWKKNLKHWQAHLICRRIRAAGCIPVVFDWDGRSPLPDQKTIFCPRVSEDDVWGGFGSGDAATIAALVSMAEAYIGVDSGPGKVASATNTPTLIVWREHHPIQFHDPAPNTTHLIPTHWRNIPPCDGKRGVQEYFEKHYRFTTYTDEYALPARATDWLSQVIDRPAEEVALVPEQKVFVCPNGIGDVLWALHKIRSIAAGEPIDLILSGDPKRDIDWRAVPFLKRFSFIRSATVLDLPVLRSERDEDKNDAQGRYRYWPDVQQDHYQYLIPNTILERGERLEQWQCEHPTDWGVVDEFDWSNTEKGDELGRAFAPFACFYLGPEEGNVDEGHNRGFLWEPKHWVELGLALRERGLRVVVVGAGYDRSFWERYVEAGARQAGMKWHDMIGKLEIGETMALIRRSRLFVSYQCGLGIFAHYLGCRVAMWWRPDGDSIHPKRLVAFDNGMKDAWTNPAITAQGKYLGLLYKRETPSDIIGEMERRGWFDNI